MARQRGLRGPTRTRSGSSSRERRRWGGLCRSPPDLARRSWGAVLRICSQGQCSGHAPPSPPRTALTPAPRWAGSCSVGRGEGPVHRRRGLQRGGRRGRRRGTARDGGRLSRTVNGRMSRGWESVCERHQYSPSETPTARVAACSRFRGRPGRTQAPMWRRRSCCSFGRLLWSRPGPAPPQPTPPPSRRTRAVRDADRPTSPTHVIASLARSACKTFT